VLRRYTFGFLLSCNTASVVTSRPFLEAFAHNLPAFTGNRIGFEVLQALVEDFAMPARIGVVSGVTAMSEEVAVQHRRGKWSQRGVPHKGWRCISTEDLGEPDLTCEMCESSAVRYAHSMEHDEYPHVLRVGVVCAGHMEQDRAGAERREQAVRSRAGKRSRWLSRRWRVSARGNEWLRADGYRVTVRQTDRGWSATVAAEDSDFVRHSKRSYSTSDQAKLAAFDFITTRLVASQKAPTTS
jgi:hypothetical protein